MASCRSRAALQLETFALRHQLGVLQRSVKRPKLTAADRLLWVWLSAVWKDWRSGVFLVSAATVIGWHRKGFRLFWTRKIRRGKPGRPTVLKEVRELIRTMSRDNPLWGAPRIYGELLKLGIEIGETNVGKYMVRRRKPPSQTWKTFLDNHLKSMVSVDFFAVPTIRFQILYVFLVLAHDRGGSCISQSRRNRRRSGLLNKCARPFLGTLHRHICSGIGIGSSAKTSSTR
jgi:putative transposase